MTTTVLRTDTGWWVQRGETAYPIRTPAVTTGELLADRAAIDGAAAGAESDATPVGDLTLLSPVTVPCRVVAQMVNYRSHATDSGINPDRVSATFFRKTSGSITGPFDDIVKPAHVQLLDYEVEIGMVAGATIEVGTTITADTLSEYFAGVVITNDVSARDLQLPKTQFYESKSYPTFTPAGPRLVLLTHEEWRRFDQLRLQLWVNGERRQNGRVGGDMIIDPVSALAVLTGFQRLDAGDLLLTGTPGGTALSAPPKPIEIIGSLIPPHVKWKTFFKRQASNPKYLKDGDIVEVRIATDDGAIDLGRQRCQVKYS
ncbi:fumarylacetoacetate hydrolase family protein [Williamsia sp. 1135]|uniref:fumarylacetoacetate hydrolase family protein n=1 Tax=Williamsia sp. 1135 TaxID=1889262 RepID=UPI000A121B24|nr:fumarylacetoacetate hydrolase family protein [Williamsia sp. 1135]ORM37886.1 fumarylacetoacetase [Williamsia sp. 1135]